MTISLCMIVKNEQAVLARCLDSVKALVDQIVVVDTGSTDETAKIARSYTDGVYDYEWKDDFSAARNYAFSLATGDYLLWLDADDVLLPQEQKKFPALRAFLQKGQPDMLFCPYEAGAISYRRERFLKRSAKFEWRGYAHECIPPAGKVEFFDLRVHHLPEEKPREKRNLGIYQAHLSRGEVLSPRDRFYYGRELFYNRLYEEAIAILTPFLRDSAAWRVNQIEACRTLADCHLAKGDEDNALRSLFFSLSYGEPRASVACKIGEIFRAQKRRKEAIFWYQTATLCKDHSSEGDFDCESDRFLRPLLELTCLYYESGEKQRALDCHFQLENIFPEHPSVAYNRAFFEKIGWIT